MFFACKTRLVAVLRERDDSIETHRSSDTAKKHRCFTLVEAVPTIEISGELTLLKSMDRSDRRLLSKRLFHIRKLLQEGDMLVLYHRTAPHY